MDEYKERHLPYGSVASEVRAHFLQLVGDTALQAWIAAHVRREFPRLACGAIWMDSKGHLEVLALPNSSETPAVKWQVTSQFLADYYRDVNHSDGHHVGFFGSRPPGLPPTSDQLAIPARAYAHSLILVIATTPEGRASTCGLYRVDTDSQYLPIATLPATHAANLHQDTFAEQNRAISVCLQTVNRELMEWLRRHPRDLLQVHPGTFELIVAEIFRDQGYEISVLGSWNQSDGGIDIIAVRRDTVAGEFRIGIQCKRYVKTQQVRADMVWALGARLEKFKLHKGVFATTARFERSVLRDLESHLWRIELRDFERLTGDLQAWGQFERGAKGLWLPKEPTGD